MPFGLSSTVRLASVRVVVAVLMPVLCVSACLQPQEPEGAGEDYMTYSMLPSLSQPRVHSGPASTKTTSSTI